MQSPPRLWIIVARLDAGLFQMITVLTIVTLVAIASLVFVTVALRYGFDIALVFSYDVSTILFAWLVFLGLAVAERDSAHMGIDLSDHVRNPRLRQAMIVVRQLLVLATVAYLTWVGTSLVERTGSQIPSMRISMRWLYAALPIGFGLLGIACIGRLVLTLRQFREGS